MSTTRTLTGDELNLLVEALYEAAACFDHTKDLGGFRRAGQARMLAQIFDRANAVIVRIGGEQ